jgi:thioredoxin reductase
MKRSPLAEIFKHLCGQAFGFGVSILGVHKPAAPGRDRRGNGAMAMIACKRFSGTETAGDEGWEEKLTKGNVRIVGMLKQIRQATENTVTVVTQRGESHEVDALYPALGCIVRSDLATGLGASSTENANLVVDDHQRTTVDGLYAAGDVVTDLHQLSVAFGHAAIAATDIHNRLPPNPR